MSSKKKKPPSGDEAKACKHCEREEKKLSNCARCGLVSYCGTDCQQADWKEHKLLCISKADRRPGAAEQVEDPQRFEGKDKCTICLEYIHPDDEMNLTLPCKHTLHGLCVASLRNKAVAQLCPTCRAELPLGPQDLFEKARDNYESIKSKVERGLASWGSLSKVAAKKMSDAIQMLKEASAQGHAGAQLFLDLIFIEGQGVKQDYAQAFK